VCATWGDVSQLLRRLGEGLDRFARGDVDGLGADAEAEAFKGRGGAGERVLVDVGQQDMASGALAARDRLPDPSGAGDDE